MIATVYVVYLVFLAAVLFWNVRAARRDADEAPTRGPRLETWLLLPQLACLAILVRDRLQPFDAPWLLEAAWLFPVTFACGVVQNIVAMAKRGARLSDIPLVLYNVGIGVCVGIATLAANGNVLAPEEAVVLYDYSVLQMLLGGRMTYVTTLSWHLPMFAMRSTPTSITQVAMRLWIPAVGAFAVSIIVANHAASAEVIGSFAREPTMEDFERDTERAWRTDLQGGVWTTPTLDGETPLGTVDAWILPADHDGSGLPEPTRFLVVALRAPDIWARAHPTDTEALQTFLDGAEHLAGVLQPEILLPFPDPDRDVLETAGIRRTPDEWATLYAEARRRVRTASPTTRTACRLSTIQSFGRKLFTALVEADAVDIAGPRLQPGGVSTGAAWADITLDAWDDWRTTAGNESPALWVLGAGASHMAFGRAAQERFIEGCVVRVQRRSRIDGILFEGWRDVGHTRGIADSTLARRHLSSMPGWDVNR